jgi:unspecific monooxygenase
MQFYEDAFRECGDIFATRIPGLGNWVYVCSPDLAKIIVEAPPDVLAGGDIEGFSLAHLLGKGATSQLDGPAHQERKDVTAPYLSTQASQRHGDEFRAITERRIAQWPLGKPFPLVLELQRIALEALVKVFFSAAGPEKIQQIADVYQRFSFKGLRSPASVHPSLQVELGPWSPWGRVKTKQREVFQLFSAEIEARLAAVGQPDQDDIILGLARARLKDGSRLSKEVVLTEILDLLFQGHELTGDSMTWTMGELITHPEVLAELRRALDAADTAADPPYLEAVVYEGLRRRHSNFFTTVRRVKQPFELGGYLLPEGTLVCVCYPALSKREDLYSKPQTFDPGHFLGQKPPTDSRCPFGSGAHACAGQGLAVVIMKTALATIVRKTDLKLAQPEVHPVRNAYWYEPNKGMLVTLERRS